MEDTFVLDPTITALVGTDVPGRYLHRAFPAVQVWTGVEAVAASATGLLAAFADTGVLQTITTGFAVPACAKNVTATITGTAADVAAVSITVSGLDIAGNAITEVLPAFTLNTLGTVVGSKAFAKVTKVSSPAHDGTGVSISIGWGEKLGLMRKASRTVALAAYLGSAREGTLPTMAASASELASNTVDLSSSLNGSEVTLYLLAA